MIKAFTADQLWDFREYENVRKSGIYNMFDPNARVITGMTKEAYAFVMRNYSELSKAVEESSHD